MEERGQRSNTSAGNGNIDDIMGDAEAKLRQGVQALGDWGARAREIIQKQPGAVLAGVAVLGFVTGLLIRRSVLGSSERRPVSRELH